MKLVLILCLVLVSQAASQGIVGIDVKTGGNPMAECCGQAGLQIFTQAGQVCTINNLDEPGNTFIRFNADAFIEGRLGGCNNFPVPNGNISQLIVNHRNRDDWQPEWFRILFSDNTFVTCRANFLIDEFQSRTIPGTNCV